MTNDNRTEREVLQEQFNNRLKELKTYEELQQFLKDMENTGWEFQLYGKRRKNVYAYAFSHLYEARQPNGEPLFYTGWERVKDRVHYLYSDTVSTGQSYVKNLHKFFRVE
jgi:hypothetical protein